MRVDIGGVRLYVDVDGVGLVPDGPAMVERPTVVLLHGGPGADHSLFKHPAYDLSDVAQVVYYDHRGNGRSDRGTPDDWNLDVWADDVVRLCDALGIERPVVLGESFGGVVAQHYLARHPDHPSRVVLGCTTPRFDIEVMTAAFERFGGAEARDAARAFWTLGPDSIGGYLQHCTPLYSVEQIAGDASAFDSVARQVMNFDLLFHFQAGEQQTLDLAPGLSAATCPVLVFGAELDPVCPIEMSEEIVAALTNAQVTYERVAGVSHADVGRRCMPLVRRFIAGDLD